MADPIRASFRRSVRVSCQVVREHDFTLVGDVVLDLSTTGMRVRTRTRILTGDEVIVSFRLPSSSAWLDAQGIVARVLHGRRPGDTGHSFGVDFVNLSVEDRSRLFASIRGLPAPDALRPPRPLAA